MISAADPKRARRLVPAIAMGLLALTAWWAFKPLPRVELREPDLAAATEIAPREAATRLALDTRGFSTPVWVAPPAPPPPPTPEPPPPPPPPLKLQLIAIVREANDTMSVMLYDPDADRMLSLKEGDALPGAVGRVIEKITGATVQIKDPPTRSGREPIIRTLALTDIPTARGGGR
jgi:hypothetical protein